jgi:hypothetical protein
LALQGESHSSSILERKTDNNLCRPDISKTLLRYLQDIVVSLVEENSALPAGVLDFILGQVKAYKDVSAPLDTESKNWD